MYNGKQICQGCGKTGNEQPRAEKDCLCSSCKADINIGRCKAIEIQQNYAYVAQFYHALSSLDFKDNTLNEGLTSVLKSIDNKYSKQTEIIIGLIGAYYDNAYNVKIPIEIANPIKSLFEKLDSFCRNLKTEKEELIKFAKEQAYNERNEIYQKGVEDGKNLLIQLNNGSLSMLEFEKKLTY